MRILDYSQENSLIGDLTDLIGGIYRDYPTYAESRADSVAHGLNPGNPFFDYGSYRGFMAYSGDTPMANVCSIIDTRTDPSIGLVGFFESYKIFVLISLDNS